MIIPDVPPGMKRQAALPERVYAIAGEPLAGAEGLKLSPGQVGEAKTKIASLFR